MLKILNIKNWNKKDPLKFAKVIFKNFKAFFGFINLNMIDWSFSSRCFHRHLKLWNPFIIGWFFNQNLRNIILIRYINQISCIDGWYMEIRTGEAFGSVVLSFLLINGSIMYRFQSLRCLWKHLDKKLQYIMLKFRKKLKFN